LKPKPRTDAERSKLLEQVKRRVAQATPAQKAAVDRLRSTAPASPERSKKD